jgi:hypothetical protein
MRYLLLINLFAVLIYAESFIDKESSLYWYNPDESMTEELTWHDAKLYCEDLEYDGYNDWRLPTVRELYTLVDVTKRDPAIKKGLKFTQMDYYWSATTSASNSSKKWCVDFKSGYVKTFHESNDYYIRCVRGVKR